MPRLFHSLFCAVSAFFFSHCSPPSALAALPTIPVAVPLVIPPIDSTDRVTLTATTPGWAALATDNGLLPSTTQIPHVILALRRSAARQAVLDQLVAAQVTKGNGYTRAWLTPKQLALFGPASQDIATLSAWLTAAGVTVNSVSPSGMRMDISATAGRIAAVFDVMPHDLTVFGTQRIAILSDPAIPAAFTPLIAGIVLTDDAPTPSFIPAAPLLTTSPPANGWPALAPADFATIYHFLPILTGQGGFGAPVTGYGKTIAILESSDFHTGDAKTFRDTFGLKAYRGTVALRHPLGCTAPGFTANEGAAAFDTEWAGVGAPDAAILTVTCADSGFRPGLFASLQSVVQGGGADVISIGASACESNLGAGFLAAWHGLLEEAAAQGISVIAAAGNSGSACDGGIATNGLAQLGLGVNGLASSPYALAVGGTDFSDTAANDLSTYWGKRSPAGTHGAALSYVPETALNNGCGNAYFPTGGGPFTACNSAPTHPQTQGIGGGGGVSALFSRPAWQSGIPGILSGSTRLLPDISFFAGSGLWGHFFLGCNHDTAHGGAECAYAKPAQMAANGAGGTSISAAITAGIIATLDQAQGGRIGLPAPRLYAIAAADYTQNATLLACNATKGNKIGANCRFANVTTGNTAIACTNLSTSCAGTDPIGLLQIAGANAYTATTGYNLATGLGSLNLANLLPVY